MGIKQSQKRLAKIRSLKKPYDLTFKGVTVRVFEHVYPTSELSELVVEYMDHPHEGIGTRSKVLDYGTGTGFLAIQAAKRGAKVVATDINPHAIECAKYNAKWNGVYDAIEFRIGKSFETIKERETFDLITAGMPWDQGEVSDYLEMALYDPGFQMRKSLFQNAKNVLHHDGYILMTYSDFMQDQYPIEDFIQGFRYDIVNQRQIEDYQEYAIKIQPLK